MTQDLTGKDGIILWEVEIKIVGILRSGFILCNSNSDPTAFPVRILLETKALEQSSKTGQSSRGNRKDRIQDKNCNILSNLLKLFYPRFNTTVGQTVPDVLNGHSSDLYQTCMQTDKTVQQIPKQFICNSQDIQLQGRKDETKNLS